ncbi:metal ABC transporter permease [Azospirillum brasilense]|uniref:Metal ABC transporter permease n=2 Tax=Azospirillum brasilense TaxID=192 RepID=A0A0P0EEU3_AZOBR|nr:MULTISPECIES: metal ABC transporter permease [Azospirillum]ALJ34128.1 manganese transporter [Azospirillum brasilense]MDW7552895.1 metal ABC transporter permease [Azospirillum brasilense]MDW7591913.1 metal ABC transporter permease [Azospirillum brasilense]MDW7627810.1 metal ABC transporter permease [Azospirillum brasilense]MDX5952721.1 metal ABC transporter permease [Azospirillum brasilense]
MIDPMFEEALRILTFQSGFNSAVVVAGTAALGLAGGTVGTFLLLRRRALVSDALSHATLPGIAVAFLVGAALGLPERSLLLLLAGAVASGVVGLLTVQALSRFTRLTEDSAIGAVLSVFFGLGVVLLSVIQNLELGGQAGLKTFILGQTAAMAQGEAIAIGLLAAGAALAVALLFKELRVLAFDPGFAAVQGWPVGALDLVLMGLATLVTVIGLQTVGLILVVALLIIPPAAARFWTDRLPALTVAAAVIGALSGWLGATLSALLPKLPAGAVIVLVAGGFFLLSFLFAPARGLVAAALRQGRLRLTFAERRALTDLLDGRPVEGATALWLRLRGYARDGALTPAGQTAARAAARDRRLWERFLADYPALLPAHANWGVDPIDSVLPGDMVRLLEERSAPS